MRDVWRPQGSHTSDHCRATQEERLQHAKSNEAFVPGDAGQAGLCQASPAMESVDLSKQAIAPPVVLSGSEMIYRRRKRCVDDESLVTVEAILLPDRSAFIPSHEHTSHYRMEVVVLFFVVTIRHNIFVVKSRKHLAPSAYGLVLTAE